jgi:rhomboid protease GluP
LQILKEDLSLSQALDASLLLEAVGIPHELYGLPDDRWLLAVPERAAARATDALHSYAVENAPAAAAEARPEYGDSLLGFTVALGLIVSAMLFGPRAQTRWFERGSAEAARICTGEWWRALTALTLHADAGHAAGNAVAAGILLTALARRVGPALAVWTALCAGLAGNLATAYSVRLHFSSIGASTAVFGALGAVSALQAPGKRAWMTLGAGVALLGFLGTGEKADLLAHLFGFIAGALLGAALRRVRSPRRSLLQPLLALAALAPLAWAWSRALR